MRRRGLKCFAGPDQDVREPCDRLASSVNCSKTYGERGVEVAIVGNEGMVGLSVFLGAASATSRAVAQVPDSARCLTVAAFRRASRARQRSDGSCSGAPS